MAKALTPVDCHNLLNAVVHQLTGQAPLTKIDSSTFVSTGETLLSNFSTENILNSLFMVIGRTVIASRPFKSKLEILNRMDSGLYSARVQKISFYSKDSVESGAFNTDLYTNFAAGYDNGVNGGQSTKDMFEQNPPVTITEMFGGSQTYQFPYTTYEVQLQTAFRSEADFAAFVGGFVTEIGNDIESQKEAFNRALLLNHIGSVYDMTASMPESAINLTTEFNADNGTTHTSVQLRTTYLDDFLKWFIAKFAIISSDMENRSLKYHWSPAKTVGSISYKLLRHTPKSKQRAILFNEFFVKAKTMVKSGIFNPDYLNLDANNVEYIDYWQSAKAGERAAIDVEPTIINTSTGEIGKGDRVQLPYVLGILYDEDALAMNYQLERVTTSVLEARKLYRTTWFTFAKNPISSMTENSVIFYMAD